jgi:hypothetical protein
MPKIGNKLSWVDEIDNSDKTKGAIKIAPRIFLFWLDSF